MANLDLDEYDRGRAEQLGGHHEVTLAGHSYRFRVDLPLEVGDRLGSEDVRGALRILLAPEEEPEEAAEALLADGLTLTHLVKIVATFYGQASLGESQASPLSSASGTTRSTRTSPGSTGSTSRRSSRATA